MDKIHSLRRADFAERVLAFALDAAPFAAGWALTVRGVSPGDPIFANPRGSAAALVWTGLFLAYQAFFSFDGRASVGKAVLGLKVVGPDGKALDATQALVRSVGYLFSQIFAAGFLWALVDPSGQAWHDLPLGSRVVAHGEPSNARRLAVGLSAGLLMLTLAGGWGWQHIWAPRYERIMTVAYARHGLDELSGLQQSYKISHGRYADNIFALATVSVDPTGFLRDAAALYDHGRVGFRADRDHYTMVAHANDVDKTLVAISGP